MTTPGGARERGVCSFCHKDGTAVAKLIAGPGSVRICSECIGLCNEILSDEAITAGPLVPGNPPAVERAEIEHGIGPADLDAFEVSGSIAVDDEVEWVEVPVTALTPGDATLAQMWAPWRSSYLDSAFDAERNGGIDLSAELNCVFCRILTSGELDLDTHVLRRTDHSVSMLNAYPYSSGHVMVMPARHERSLEALSAEETSDLWASVNDIISALTTSFGPEGFNIGLNLGRAAGAAVPGHLHVHVVPRWVGDTNFMTALAATRVIPESLGSVAARIRAVLA